MSGNPKTVKDLMKAVETSSKSGKVVIVDFHANWCSVCKKCMPAVDKLAKDNAEFITTLKIDVDQAKELAAYFNVDSLPTFVGLSLKDDSPLNQFFRKEGFPVKDITELYARGAAGKLKQHIRL